jgi:hypothetical protein
VRLICFCLLALPPGLAGQDVYRFPHAVNGGALAGERIAAWGEGITILTPDGVVVARSGKGRYERGGCAFDGGLIINEAGNGASGALGRAVHVRLPDLSVRPVDTDASFRDCLEAELFGRRGVLVTHRQMQVRFYERPAGGGQRWPYREIYSIYTASAQSGLALMDVDGDGRMDILHGNYWIQSPAEFDHPWRIFAFNNWWDQPRSAMLRIAPVGGGSLFAAESESSPARFSQFDRPADPRQFWREIPLPGLQNLRKPAALAVDGKTVLVGEDAGEGSRLIAIQGSSAEVADTSGGYLEIWPEQGVALTRNALRRYRRK